MVLLFSICFIQREINRLELWCLPLGFTSTKLTGRLSDGTFVNIGKDILIKIYDSVDFMPNEDWIKFKASTMSPKAMIKRIIKKH